MSVEIFSQQELLGIIRPLLLKHHADHAILFGSYARQEATPASDIDLVVVGGVGYDPTDVFALADELHRLTEKKVDVYDESEINAGSELQETIKSEGIIVTI